MRAGVVFNPRSAAGRTGRRREHYRRSLAELGFDSVVFMDTTGPADGGRCAKHLVQTELVDVLVVVGGDGTLNEVANGLLRSSRPGVPVMLVPAGTGSDFARMLSYGRDDWDGIRAALSRPPAALDVMACRFEGADEPRFALNVSGIGLAGEIVRRANRSSKRWGGKLTFLWATLSALFGYRPHVFRLRWRSVAGGEEHEWTGRLANAFVANGRHCGGGMDLGPGCDPTDGALSLIVVPHDNLWSLLRRIPYLYNGRIERAHGLILDRVSHIVAEPVGVSGLPGECDGESPGDLPVDVSFAKRRLHMFGIRQ